jgi:hypothetical protein
MFSDLLQKCLDAEFDDTYPENGSFLLQTRRGRQYWYYKGFSADPQGGAGKQYLKYGGPKGNEELDKRVQRFERVKSGYRERRQLATKLRQAGMPSPIAIEGQVVQALSKAGMFRLRSVLVGSVAFQTYGGLLGVRLPDLSMRTDDIDVAQYFSISQQIDDKVEDLEQALKSVDESFSPVFHPNEPKLVASFRNRTGFKVEVLTPNRGAEEYEYQFAEMPALGPNIGAQVLRFLDYLIHEPVSSLILYDAGVVVTVPAPERYAVHKLLVAISRPSTEKTKIAKDRRQASDLIEAFQEIGRLHDIGLAWMDAWERGNAWKRRLRDSALRLEQASREMLKSAIIEACRVDQKSPDNYLFDKAA